MPSLEAYRRELDYSYAPGLFPSVEALENAPDRVRRLLISGKAGDNETVQRLSGLCAARHIRVETADKALSRLSGKENCYAAAVFEKRFDRLSDQGNHIMLHQTSDAGNMGTILRTALGFGYRDIAIVRPAVDVFHPHTVRASMGALFSLRVAEFESFDEYRAAYPGHALYPFMLTGSVGLNEAAANKTSPFCLIFGNEGSGLPEAFAGYGRAVRIPHSDRIDSLNLSIAAAIGMYTFAGERLYGTAE